MNIHITDENLFNSIRENSIFEIEVGSAMYGLKNENSDTDILIIYINPINNRMMKNSHHQLQFKKGKTDYILTSLEQFCTNIISGDSTINYEVLQSQQFKEAFPGLANTLNFYNTNIIKSYLGMAKRDLKTIRKQYNPKTASHFLRGIIFAESIVFEQNNNISNLNTADYNLIKSIKLGVHKLTNEDLDFYEYVMNKLRESLVDNKISCYNMLRIENEISEINLSFKELLSADFTTKEYFIRAELLGEFGY